MKLRFYLFAETVQNFGDTIKTVPDPVVIEEDSLKDRQPGLFPENEIETSPFYSEGWQEDIASFRQLSLSTTNLRSLPFDVEVWVLEKQGDPDWFKFIAKYVDANDRSKNENVSRSMYGMLVLIRIKPENRIFAISFGYGHNLVRFERLESGFGRQVVLNSIPRAGLRSLDVHNIDLTTRMKRIAVSKASGLPDFRLDGEDVIVVAVEGSPRDHTISNGRMDGRDSLALYLNDRLEDMGNKCRQLLNIYQRDDTHEDHFKVKFPEISRCLPITGSQREELNQLLFDALNHRQEDNISLMLPDLDFIYSVRDFVISYKEQQIGIVENFELNELYRLINKVFSSTTIDWFQVRVGVRREGKHNVSSWFYLNEAVIYLHESNKEKISYLYSLGNWYEITSDYQERLRQKISSYETYSLPNMQPQQQEEQYNHQVASTQNMIFMDRQLISLSDLNRIEVADLITEDWHFICVKRGSSVGTSIRSSTLSHLFAQGSTSAILLSQEPNYRRKVRKKIKEAKPNWEIPFTDKNVIENQITFVYAISVSENEALVDRLPLFSMITLSNHAEEINKLGYKVKLCKIKQL